MSETLIIRLPSAPAQHAEWLVVDAFGARTGNVARGPLASAATLAVARKVVVLVPGTDVLLTRAEVPTKSGAKLALMVPYALEEQLAADVETLHFAVAKRDESGGVLTAVVAHERMLEWQAMFATAGFKPDALYAETAAMPTVASGLGLLVDDSRVYVHRENAPAGVLEVEPLIEALQLALGSGGEGKEHVTIFLTPETYERERDLFEGLREFTASLQLKLMPDGPVPLLAPAAVQGQLINLLQGRYQPKRALDVSFAPWRSAAIFVGVLIAAHLGGKVFALIQLKKTEAELDSQIASVYQLAMPGQPFSDPLEARKQVEARLSALRGAGGSGGFLTMLNTVGAALQQSPDTRLEVLAFRNNIADLRVLAPSVDTLDRIRTFATQRGLSAEIQGTNPRDSKTEGRLQLKPT
jgi:general secretion pathway protein L